MRRRTFLSALGTGVGAITLGNMRKTRAAEIPGVTATEIRIGNTMPYSGIGSDFGVIGRGDAAYFRMINDQGGINGRMIHFISLDDSYTPPKTVEQTRRLLEQDQAAFIFNGLGTAPGSAVRPYLNHEHVPQLFLMTGADKWGNFQQFPWTLGWQPSYRTEAQIYAKYILANRPDAKIALFWQNDDWGKDFVTGVKDVLSERFDRMVVRSVSYEATDPTVDSQVVAMQSSGADTVVSATASVKFAQAVRKMHALGWKPLHLVSNNAASIGGV
ncbi:MAG: ABC transporter substrate-binding protein, partial [Acetobacteraceae bacterium]|nr:ABC transporter substrate-binding protein [Acetobacteraceae bacterium]